MQANRSCVIAPVEGRWLADHDSTSFKLPIKVKRAEDMGRPGPATHAKRARERAKQEKRKAKQERRALRKELKAQKADRAIDSDEDPDIAGIVPGPQEPLQY